MSNNLIIGGGAWGTAIANLVAENSEKKTFIWSYEKEVKDNINNNSKNNTYLPAIKLTKNVIGVNNFLKPVDIRTVYIVVPSKYVYKIIKNFLNERKKNRLKTNPIYVICSKGIDLKRKEFLSNTISNLTQSNKIAVLSGHTFADQLAKRLPTAATLAC